MRLPKVAFSGIGGLRDGELVLPAGSIAAVAGANGTGKSKLLAALLAPWTQNIPTPAADRSGEVHVTITVDETERAALERFSREMGWGDFNCPPEFMHTTRRTDVAGVNFFADHGDHPALRHFGTQPPFLTSCPSMDVLYLPAERRLVAAGGGIIDLQQLNSAVAQSSTATGRSSAQNYGRLDDGDFENYARALCVADQLADDPDDPDFPEESGPATFTEHFSVAA